MKPLLEELWYGNIAPQEQSTEHNREIKALLGLIGKNRDTLSATLTDDQKKELEKFEDCIVEMYSIVEREVFAYGFRLGGRIVIETLAGSDHE